MIVIPLWFVWYLLPGDIGYQVTVYQKSEEEALYFEPIIPGTAAYSGSLYLNN